MEEEDEFSPLGFQDLSQGPDMQGSNEQRGILGCVMREHQHERDCSQLEWILGSPFFPFKSVLSVLFCKSCSSP